MKRAFVVSGMVCLLTSMPASAAETLRRFSIVVGANAADGRPKLRYAEADAERFAGVLMELGGVRKSDLTSLSQPTALAVNQAVRALRTRVDEARATSGRVETVFYYSGHADESGLLLGSERVSYKDLRDELNAAQADVRIAVLDACASGAMTRLKGGSPRLPFLVDASSNMKGHAFLTSSSADEAAQESDRIRGSFFTHYLVSGLRGAADASGEGKVTLNEAYQYAFNETLGRTLTTQSGPQHPSYDIDLTGTGDVVITDLRETSSSLVLDADISGRCYVREQKAGLVIEVEKPMGRRIELGVGPGRYEVHCQNGGSARSSVFKTEDGAAHVLSERDFSKTKLDPTLQRGGPDAPPVRDGMDGVFRVSLEGSIGHRLAGTRSVSFLVGPVPTEVVEGQSQTGFTGHLAMTHWTSPRVGLEFRIHSLERTRQSPPNVRPFWSDKTFVTGFLVGGRYELNRSSKVSAARPFLHASVGPYFRPASSLPIDPAGIAEKKGAVLFGTSFGAGLDLRFGSHLGIGIRASYDLLPDYENSSGDRFNYRALRITTATSWFFGGKKKP